MLDVEYSILGPLTVQLRAQDAPLHLGEKLQLLLGRLLLEPGVTLSAEALVADVWGEETELSDARNTVQSAVRQLRQRLGDTDTMRKAVVSVGSGYRLAVADPLSIDAERFRALTDRGIALAGEHPRAASAMLEEALATWRGRVLGPHADVRWVAAHAAELESLRAAAEVELGDIRLRLGEHTRVEAALRRQIVEHPTDERRRAQLVRALDGAGRAAEAGLAYRDAARELGAVGPELRRLGDRIGRGLRAEDPRRVGPGSLTVGRADTPLLCAALRSPERQRGEPRLGTLTLLVDRRGGVPHPLGDRGLVATFDDVRDAVLAASAMADDPRLRAAVAVHVGATVLLGDRLVGSGSARCQLLARAAHASQVLISEDARSAMPGHVALRDLGAQRLEDLLPGEPVYALEGVEVAAATSPPATLNRRPHNLPVQSTRFVGRAFELAELSRLVAAGQLVTLLGVGGCGKTRLALQLAARRVATFDDGAWFVELAELPSGGDGDALAALVANQLGVRPLPSEGVAEAIARHLSDRAALLILDNCEHVLEPCVELVRHLRAAAPRLCIVITSRQPLRVDGERMLEVPAMGSAASPEPDRLPDAVELLLDRAGPIAGLTPDDDLFADATRICRAFEGSPLAIELAAPHIATRGLSVVAGEVESMVRGELGLDWFASDDPARAPRQRTIEAAIRWSHALLDERERVVLHRLGVLRGGFGLEEAVAVASDGALGGREVTDVVHQLVDHSMVSVEPPLEGTLRLRLSQPIRTFALAQLADEDLERTRARHVDAYLRLATATAPRLFGPGEHAALERLEADHDNFRAALTVLVDAGRSRDALRMVGALWWLWFSHGHFEEGGRWVQAVLDLDERPSRERVRALRAASHLSWWRGAYAKTDQYNRALQTCATAIGDAWGLAWAPMGFGAVQLFPDPRGSLPRFEESRRRFMALGCRWEAGYALQLIGAAHWFAGDEHLASKAYEQAVEIYEDLGHGSVLASVRRGSGFMAARCGNPGRGAVLCSDALRISDAIGDEVGSAQALNFLAAISRDEGDHVTALERFADALAQARKIGELWATCSALDGIAGLACASGDAELAARLLACSQRVADRAGYRQSAYEQQLRATDVQRLVRVLGGREYERAVAEGELMTVGEAVAAALAYAARS